MCAHYHPPRTLTLDLVIVLFAAATAHGKVETRGMGMSF
jgi:hypothetical protein